MISLRFITSLNIQQILLIGLLFRLLAAFFSQGYVFHDDHFFVAEMANNWKNEAPDWLTRGGDETMVLSLIYPALHLLLFKICDKLGIHNPDDLMLIIRLLHGLFSLLTVYYGYLLTRRLSKNEELGRLVGLIFATYWFFPFLSVHTVREFTCIPFLLMGSYYLADENLRGRFVLLSALFFALSVCLRMQTILIPFGIGLYLLLSRYKFKTALLFGIAFIISLFLTQGMFDLLLYGDPFASTIAYIRYNITGTNISQYPTGPWYQYVGTLAGMVLGLPFLLFAWGYIKSLKLSNAITMLFIGSLLFFIYHSIYPGKQERFILPFFPFFVLLGCIGFHFYYEIHREKKWLRSLTRSLIIWFLLFNTAGLLFLTFSYSKRSRVEAMNYLRKKGDVSNIILEGIGTPPYPPLFYLQKDVPYYMISSANDVQLLKLKIDNSTVPRPNYLIMTGNKDLENRLNRLRTVFPLLKHEKDIQPGLLDNIAYKLNPSHNLNEVWKIYRIE